MAGSIYTSESSGDWATATVWNTGSVPDSSTADVTIATDVTIAPAESFAAGSVDVAAHDKLTLEGSLDVTAGATVGGGVSLDGGSLSAGAGLTLATLSSTLGGSGTVSGSIDNAGLIYAASGLFDLAGPVSGSGPLEVDLATGTSATLELGQGGTEAVAFVGQSLSFSVPGVLRLDAPGAYSGTISGFNFNEAIDLRGLAPGSLTESFSGTSALGTLAISNASSIVAGLVFAGDYVQNTFSLVPDGHGGTDVELVAPASETAIADGDWSNPAIWSADSVPDSSTVGVHIPVLKSVTIASGESFVAGAVDIESNSSIGFGFLDVSGRLNVAGGLTLEAAAIGEELGLAGGSVSAGTIIIEPGADVEGSGRLASPGTLTNDGLIFALDPLSNLTVAPACYTQSGELDALETVLILDPSSGPSGFANLVNGTLTGGTYAAESGGTLALPGSITAIDDAAIIIDGGLGIALIEGAGTTLQTSLASIGTNATLSLDGYDYVTTNTLTVIGGTIALDNGAVLNLAELVLSSDPSELVGAGTITGNVANSGNIIARNTAGGDNTLVLFGSVSGSGSLEIGTGSTLEVAKVNTEAVSFDVSNPPFSLPGVLRLDDPGAYSGVISGFGLQSTVYGNVIDLPGFAPGTLGDVYNGTTAGGTLEILAPGSIVANLSFSGDYTEDNFKLFPGGSGGTDIALAVLPVAPCFARGTRIATPRGEVAVEDLGIGDRVLTASGEARPIVWIGQRRVDCARHPRTDLVHPVRIRPGAFAEGRPKRDVHLSPDHALFWGGALIPVHHLINGATIVREKVASVHYFHIELDRHDVLLAECLPVESYLDTGNRAQFENGAAHISLHPDFSSRSWDDACAPLCTEGPLVSAARRELLQRAAALGYQPRTEPGLHVAAGARALRPASVKGRLYQFLLPTGTREARIVSRTGVPAGLDLEAADCRTLGARIGAVFVGGKAVGLDNPALAEGFHPIERNGVEVWRWTDGAARLVLPDKPDRAGSVLLELLVRDTMPGWQAPAAPGEVAAAA